VRCGFSYFAQAEFGYFLKAGHAYLTDSQTEITEGYVIAVVEMLMINNGRMNQS
jgi:hypothetical protein